MNWDAEEDYIIADELEKKIRELSLEVEYKQISSCAGVINTSLNEVPPYGISTTYCSSRRTNKK